MPVYSDPQDAIPQASIRYQYGVDWEALDLSLVQDLLSSMEPPHRALDAGCGRGRLLPALGRDGLVVDLVEPDPRRAAAAAAEAAKWLQPGWSVHCLDVATFARSAAGAYQRYDLVLCSHVLQHVASQDRMPLVRHLAELLQPGSGRFLLTFASSGGDPSRHVITEDRVVSSGRSVETRMASTAAFDAVVAGGREGVLPVWQPSIDDVVELIEGASLTVVEASGYRAFEFAVSTEAGAVTLSAVDAYVTISA